ncbi:hypothetical protein KAFR_0C02040 [Kazachstania africana CBS 2517]|uniref:Transcription activator GCR1-like domain-containing protein n=1 Tax=Kazachstania africana (strain ATCC 22294 / BCRC 22015 / CBS 2517 / CECT 1963 / NBRC 1671 / NRRL Y-8276) TaxID=1071382 RepID=H2AS47_KAZAF|nr:hypothetical protein KAFR_0C02040 [Kazachstania africana CBS 2517]CCF57197.1 hypothetical protein KAFR_0C02040 [Kazachstania africana CBS 2517]
MTEEGDLQSQVRKLSDTLSPRILHQYKTYYTQYIHWCQYNKVLVTANDNDPLPYKDVPVSAQLIHRFLLDTLITNTDEIFSLQKLKEMINSLRFLYKLCAIHGNENDSLDDTYLDSVVHLHEYWSQRDTNMNNLAIISLNLWNSNSNGLKETYFKGSLEKSRYLLDFHLVNYLRLSYTDRSKLKLASFKVNKENNIVLNNTNITLLPQDCPFLCPYTSMATYLYFRFYGVKSISKGEGFPNLLKDTNDDLLASLPIIKGRLTEYPKETTLGLGYASLFKYCNLSYTKKNYFEIPSSIPRFPSSTQSTPFDFKRILNFKSPYVNYDASDYNSKFSQRKNTTDLPPTHLINQLFPEIESYKHNYWNSLSEESKNFINLLEFLRLKLVINLPIIFKFFPNHDLFKDPLFQNADVYSYLNDPIFELNETSVLPFEIVPGSNQSHFMMNDIFKQLIEIPDQSIPMGQNSQTNIPARNVTNQSQLNEDTLDDFRKQNFQFIQFQTLSNFKTLILFLSKIFDNLSMKKSSKDSVIRQLTRFNDSIVERINKTTPKDIKEYFLKNEIIRHSQDLFPFEDNADFEKPKEKKRNSFKLLAVGDSSSDEENEDFLSSSSEDESKDSGNDSSDEEDENMQEELKFLVDTLVNSKVDSAIAKQMNKFQSKMNLMIESLIEEKVKQVIDNSDIGGIMRKRKYVDDDDDENGDDPVKSPSFVPRETIDKVKTPRFKIQERPISSPLSMDSIRRQNKSSTPKAIAHTHTDENVDPHEIREPQDSHSEVEKEDSKFRMDPSINTIEGVILEWFTPNPNMHNECVHSMNKTNDKTWRSGFETLYKQRKQITEFYVHLINLESLDRYKAIEICNDLRGDKSIKEFAKYLKQWKKEHDNSFSGLYK